MINLRSLGNVPKSYRNTDVYTITTRDSIFGFHRNVYQPNIDLSCTKTMLLLASEKRVMEQILEQMSREMSYGYTWNRIMKDNTIVREKVIGSMMPLSLTSISIDDVEQLCWLHHFDMFVAYSLESKDTENIDLFGYEYLTWEPPNRGITEKYMKDMLYKNI